MRNGVRSIALIALSAWLAAFASAQEEYTLKLQVKEGDTFKYRFTLELTFGEQSAVVTMNMTNKVLKFDGDGNIIMESSSSDGVVKFGEQEMPLPPSPATKTTYKPDGTPIKVEGGENPEGSLRIARLNAYFFPSKPVKIGDKWSAELKSEGSAPALKADFELVAKEKIGDTETLKIKFTLKEVGENVAGEAATITGHTWIDPKTGMLVRLNASVKGLPAAGSPMPLDGTMTIERIP
ncbi:MAG: hypothetical protein ABDI19_11640 [Armatimonadota bacterium]